MADNEEGEFAKIKRARLSSETSPRQSKVFIDFNGTEESKCDSLLNGIGSELSVSLDNGSFATESREQHGGITSHDRLESDDFPTCFSVEDDVDNLDEHHFQPIAGIKTFLTLYSLWIT